MTQEQQKIQAEIREEGIAATETTLDTAVDTNDPEALYEILVHSIHKYHPSDDLSLVRRAFEIARDAHKDQKPANLISFTPYM